MSGDIRLGTLLRKLQEEFLGLPIVLRPHKSESDPAITHFLHILNVPMASLHTAAARAFDMALDCYGEDPVPLHITAVDPELTARYFPDSVRPMSTALEVHAAKAACIASVRFGPLVEPTSSGASSARSRKATACANTTRRARLQVRSAIAAIAGISTGSDGSVGLQLRAHDLSTERWQETHVPTGASNRLAA